ncbi:MAG: hypothetical protein LH605_12080 [Microbacteriaceae bacterium]|nr:hypothetical protein [Microbacteriaceae bacterium]
MGARALLCGTASHLFRPKRDLWLTAWVVWAAVTLPVFLTLYVLTVPAGRWAPFVGAHVGLLLLFALAAQRLKGAGVALAPDGIRERAYFGRVVFTPVDLVASVILIQVFDSLSNDISHQLFIVDANGRTLLRLRGQLWHPTDLKRIASFYSVPVHAPAEVVTWRELRRDHGSKLSWFERHALLTRALLVLGFLAVAVPSYAGIMSAIS